MAFLPAAFPPPTITPPIAGTAPLPPGILADRFEAVDPNDATKGVEIFDLLVGDDPTDAAILWQFSIEQGAGAANGTNGTALAGITKATPSAPQQIKDEGQRIAQRFVDRGDIDNVTVEGGTPGTSTRTKAISLRYHNRHTDKTAGAVP